MKRILPLTAIVVLILCLFSCDHYDYLNPLDPKVDSEDWAPSNLQIQAISDTEVRLSWVHDCNYETEYRIERRIGSGSFQSIGKRDRAYPQNKYATRIAAMMPAKSAASPQTTACRVRLMPTEPKYTART